MARRQTRLAHWARIWEAMEELGIPTDSQEAQTWAREHNNPQASLLLTMLDGLQNKELSMDTIEMIGESLIAAFKMGQVS